MGDWSNLPFDLLNEIVTRFETIEDLVYFSVVCRCWYHFASVFKNEFNMKEMPWLLLVENTKDNIDCLRKVLNPVDNKCYQWKLREMTGCRCWGSAYGWVVTYDYDLELYLFNPLTKAKLTLPPVSCLPYKYGPHVSICTHEGYEGGRAYKLMRSYFITKAFVLKVTQDDFIVFVTYYFTWKKLAFARPGDHTWTFIDPPGDTVVHEEDNVDERTCVVDVVFRDGRIVILYEASSLGYLDFSDLCDPQKLFAKDDLPKYPMILSEPRNLGIKAREYVPPPPRILDDYLVNSFGLYLVDYCGKLLMVLRDRWDPEIDEDGDANDDATFGFKVYQLDFDTKKWFQVQRLDNVVLLVGNNSSMLVPLDGASNQKANRIYFTDDRSDGKDMGVFDLESSEIKDVYDGCDRYSKLQTPFWFIPRF